VVALPVAGPGWRRSFTYEEFNACQQRHQKKAAEGLAVRNEEVLRSIEDIIQLVRCDKRLWGPCSRLLLDGSKGLAVGRMRRYQEAQGSRRWLSGCVAYVWEPGREATHRNLIRGPQGGCERGRRVQLQDMLSRGCRPPLPARRRTYPRENPQCVLDEHEVDMFRAYYSGIMYKVGGGARLHPARSLCRSEAKEQAHQDGVCSRPNVQCVRSLHGSACDAISAG
jgi:hypothetical protein